MPRLGTERGSVQYPLIKYATEAGWTYVDREDAERMRRGKSGLLLHDVFLEQAQKLNPGVVDANRANDLIGRIERVPPRIEGNLEAWEYLKGLKTIFVPEEKRERNVKLLEERNWAENEFHVTDELTFTNGTHTIRVDVAFFVNGFPVLLIETKSSRKLDGIAEAIEQIRRYHREGSELLTLMQAHTLTHLVKFYYGPTWSTSRKSLFNWKEESAGEDFESLVKTFIHPQRVVRVLSDFILFTRKDDELTKVILRPHQMRATERVVGRAADDEKRRGLVWHTQGSGKTYTMITVAKRLIEEPTFENPTVLMLVDRNELEQQLFGNLESCGIASYESANSKKHLRELLRRDQRGLIVSMIHKFDEMPANLNERENIYVLVDEAHRTTGGDLGTYLMAAIPNATYVGFTGTPIDKTAYGKGTFKIFGTDDPKGYLDKYSIRESVADGTTVPLHYTLAPSDLRVDRDVLEDEFVGLAEAEGVSDVEELNKILEKAVTLRTMLKKPERIDKVAKYIAKHYKETIEPMGYKAFVVGVDRKACAQYKEALDRYLPVEESRVVYSAGHNDTEDLAKYHLSSDEEKQVRKDFRDPETLPKILIVTQKLLTGFDAPILYCMYLDKPMRDHVLLQAIARVNRPYEDEEGRKKPAGFVLDFVGIFEKLEKALAFDSKDVEGVIHDLDLLKERFSQLMQEARDTYLGLAQGKGDDKAVEAILEHFRDEDTRHEFYEFFRQLADLHEILSPDKFLRPYLDDYRLLADTYMVLRSEYEAVFSDKELQRKTASLVQKHTRSGDIRGALKIQKIDENTLDRLQEEDTSDTVKVFNLLKSLREKVETEATVAPYLLSIGERAETIIEQYQERQVSTQVALQRLEDLVKEVNEAQAEQEDQGLSGEVFAVYWLLRKAGVDKPEEAAQNMARAFDEHPHWAESAGHERGVRTELYKVLLASNVEGDEVSKLAQKVMDVVRRAKK